MHCISDGPVRRFSRAAVGVPKAISVHMQGVPSEQNPQGSVIKFSWPDADIDAAKVGVSWVGWCGAGLVVKSISISESGLAFIAEFRR